MAGVKALCARSAGSAVPRRHCGTTADGCCHLPAPGSRCWMGTWVCAPQGGIYKSQEKHLVGAVSAAAVTWKGQPGVLGKKSGIGLGMGLALYTTDAQISAAVSL